MNFDDAMNILDNINAIAVTDKNGKYTYVNSQYTLFMGKAIDELRNCYIWDVVPETKAREIIQNKKPIIATPIKIKDTESFCSYYPLFKNDQFYGIMIVVIFSGIEAALRFSKIAYDLEKKMSDMKLNAMAGKGYNINNIIGQSPAIEHLRKTIVIAARTPSTVLIAGETGCGKELVASAIHQLSARKDQPFITCNCSAIPANLMESEFFGYESGAFTGAKKGGKPGKFELANNGTLFLDEIHQMPYEMQPKLLRAIQEKEIEHIGGTRTIPLNIRIIAATNVSLENEIIEKRFREDLYYRLNVIRIIVPPLRERKEDIPLLARNTLYKLNYSLGLDIPDIDPAVYDLLQQYDWPGNVRELQNMIESAMNHAYNQTLKPEHFESLLNILNTEYKRPTEAVDIKKQTISSEYQMIMTVLKKNHYNKQKTAAELGISRSTLYHKLQKYDEL